MYIAQFFNEIGIANGDELGDELGDKLGDKTDDGTRAKIAEILKTNNQTTIPELAELLNISSKGVEYHITKMKRACSLQTLLVPLLRKTRINIHMRVPCGIHIGSWL